MCSPLTYLSLAIDKVADYGNTLCSWNHDNENVTHLFTKQSIPMIYDFAEANLVEGSLAPHQLIKGIIDPIEKCLNTVAGYSSQKDIAEDISVNRAPLVSTDPPYYDNVSYADLADFFYVWLKKSLGATFPELFTTVLTPKTTELVATAYRFDGDKKQAEIFFKANFAKAFANLRANANSDFPLTVYYAFKQTESSTNHDKSLAVTSTGWETMLDGLLEADFQVTGTWPIRSERGSRSTAQGTNALASSIVLVCRPRPDTAPTATRREFLTALRRELPQALRELQQGNIAPVDLAQASIGPGMAVFSRYAKVLESDGKPMPVRAALAIINQMLDEVLAEQEGEFGPDTRWALSWFEQYSMGEGPYGDAETLSKAKNTSVSGMVEAGILHSRSGKVRLLKRSELPADWDPLTDNDTNIWEATQHLVKRLEEGGEEKAAALLAALGSTAEIARDLAYRLYSLCERKKWAQEALAYNALVSVWPELTKLAANLPQPVTVSQPNAFGGQ